MTNLKKAYKRILEENFPELMQINLGDKRIFFEKIKWKIPDKQGNVVEKGLRYGENPNQPAALYKPINLNLVIGDVEYVHNGELVGSLELLKSGKHPGKINITDIDSALNLLKYFSEPACAIIKHNNPCGFALADDLTDAYINAFKGDVIAAFGGVVSFNRAVDKETANEISKRYYEVVAAPDYEEGVIDILEKRKNLRITKIKAMDKLYEFQNKPYIDFKSLIDGSIILQQSYISKIKSKEDLMLAEADHKEKGNIKIVREPTPSEYENMIFAWHVLEGVTSNSSLFFKDKRTVAIATGEQDRVGGIKIAIKKAYEKHANWLSFLYFDKLYDELEEYNKITINKMVKYNKGDLVGSVLATDGFMPYRDNILAIIGYGVKGVIQPGGSIKDYDVIQEANKHDITMVFTGQRCFRH